MKRPYVKNLCGVRGCMTPAHSEIVRPDDCAHSTLAWETTTKMLGVRATLTCADCGETLASLDHAAGPWSRLWGHGGVVS